MHLVHPALVHFAVAFLAAGCVLEAWGLLARRVRLARAGQALVLAGTLALVPTVASGFLALNSVEVAPAAQSDVDSHERMGIIVLGFFAAMSLWKGWHRGVLPATHRAIYAVALAVGLALVVGLAFLGGRMVYHHGVGVG